MHIFLHPNLKFLNLISDLANKDDRPAIIFQLLLQFDLVLLGWNQFKLLCFILLFFFTFGWLLNRMAWSEIIVINLKYLIMILNRGRGTGEAGEARASPEFRGFTTEKFFASWKYEGGSFSCFTGKKLVPRPLIIIVDDI